VQKIDLGITWPKTTAGNLTFLGCLTIFSWLCSRSLLASSFTTARGSLPANDGASQVQHMKGSAVSGEEQFPALEMAKDLSENAANPPQLGLGWGRRRQRWYILCALPEPRSAQQLICALFPPTGLEPRHKAGPTLLSSSILDPPLVVCPLWGALRAQLMQLSAKAFPSSNYEQILGCETKGTFLPFRCPICKHKWNGWMTERVSKYLMKHTRVFVSFPGLLHSVLLIDSEVKLLFVRSGMGEERELFCLMITTFSKRD